MKEETELNKEEFQFLKETYCEACMGIFAMDETRCFDICRGFDNALLELRKENTNEKIFQEKQMF